MKRLLRIQDYLLQRLNHCKIPSVDKGTHGLQRPICFRYFRHPQAFIVKLMALKYGAAAACLHFAKVSFEIFYTVSSYIRISRGYTALYQRKKSQTYRFRQLDSSDTFRFYILFISSSISSSEKLSGSTFAI